MALEVVNHIADLIATNPSGADPKSQGDDHLRNIKKALITDFAGFTGAILVTGTDGGAANAYTVNPAISVPAYSNRMGSYFHPRQRIPGQQHWKFLGWHKSHQEHFGR
jgi:hypothetical protein